MKSYQDFLECGENEQARRSFILAAIADHKASRLYRDAVIAADYSSYRNTTIRRYQKVLHTVSGKAVPDTLSANYKMCSNFFNRFVVQENQYLLGNGVMFNEEGTKERLGGSDFDTKMQQAGLQALIGGCSYLFFNLDHIEVFKVTEFVPLIDEENGALKAGIRFWQIAGNKPLRATLFEIDGYTDYIRKKDDTDLSLLAPKRAYTQIVRQSVADGIEIYDGRNYPSFPIVPLWGNPYHQSEIVGLRENIDCYDLIKSGFANDIDDASAIYWTLENCGGMDDIDLATFVQRMKTVKAAVVSEDAGAKAEAHTIDIPYQGRETYLQRLENDMYNDAMALNVLKLSASNVTATQINAAYEPLNNKTDQFEYNVIEAIKGILNLLGIKDEPAFKRSKIVNQQEETQVLLLAAEYLDSETILKHLPFISPDEVQSIIGKVQEEELDRFEEAEKNIEKGGVEQ